MLTRFAKLILYISIFMAAAGLGTYLTIHLLIGSDNRVVVPDLVGKDVVYALEVLSDLGLNTKVKGSEFNPSIPKHHIIDQSPDPGTEIKHGRDVRLVISKGVRSVVFPNVVGMELSMAGIILEENDLRQSDLSYTYSKQSKGKVLSQYPLPGTQGVRGDAIGLLISAGPTPRRLRMLDLTRMSLDDAIEAIEAYQLTVGKITPVDDRDFPVDTVVAQSPMAGSPVLSAAAVDLTINRPNPKGVDTQRTDATLFRYRTAHGYLRQQIRVRITRPDAAFNLFNDFVKPGEEIWLIIFRDAPTALFLYLDGELKMTKHYE